jgi:hypothetical protein
MPWNNDIPFDELRSLAGRLEAVFAAANERARRLAALEPGEVLEGFAVTQAALLRFDEFEAKRFRAALEEAQVRTLAGDNIFLSCVLSAAVALRQFKHKPRAVAGRWARMLGALQDKSTAAPTLWLFSVASLYGVFGKGAVRHIAKRRTRKRPVDV